MSPLQFGFTLAVDILIPINAEWTLRVEVRCEKLKVTRSTINLFIIGSFQEIEE
jgi:hypothetical protein